MTKPMRIMLICVGILFGSIFAYKLFTYMMMKHFLASNKEPIVTVSAAKAEITLWDPKLKATGSLRTVKGVDVTTELAGMVREIYLVPGTHVEKGDLLVQLGIDAD